MLDLTAEGVNASSTDIDDRRCTHYTFIDKFIFYLDVFQIIAMQQQQQQQQQVMHKLVPFNLVYFVTSSLEIYFFKQKVLNLVMR